MTEIAFVLFMLTATGVGIGAGIYFDRRNALLRSIDARLLIQNEQMKQICAAYDKLVNVIAEPAQGKLVTMPLSLVLRALTQVGSKRTKETGSTSEPAGPVLTSEERFLLPRDSISQILRSEFPELSGAPDELEEILQFFDDEAYGGV